MPQSAKDPRATPDPLCLPGPFRVWRPRAVTAYSEFRIRIEPGARKGQYRVEASGLGRRPDRRRSRSRSRTKRSRTSSSRSGRPGAACARSTRPQLDLAKTFGGQLFVALMHGPVGELYRSSFSTAQAAGNGTAGHALADGRRRSSRRSPGSTCSMPRTSWRSRRRRRSSATSTCRSPRRPLEVGLPHPDPRGRQCADRLPRSSTPTPRTARLSSALKPLLDANAVSIDWLEEATLPALTKKLRPRHLPHPPFHRSWRLRPTTSGKGALLFEDDAGRGSPDQRRAAGDDPRTTRRRCGSSS